MLNIDDFAGLPRPKFDPEAFAIEETAAKGYDAGVLTLLLARHIAGDSGDMFPAAKESSQKALATGQPYISVFHVFGAPSIAILTVPDRSVTIAALLEHALPEVKAMATPAFGASKFH